MVLSRRHARVAALSTIVSLYAVSAGFARPPAPNPKPDRLNGEVTEARKARKDHEDKAGKAKAKPAKGPKKAPGASKKKAKPKTRQTPGEQTLVLVLRHTAAERVAHHVERLFRGAVPVRVSADEPTNILLVRGDAETLQQVRHMVKELEQAAADTAQHAQRQVRVFRIQYADAQRVGGMICELAPFSLHGAPPTVEWDSRTNALLINAMEADWPAIETVVEAVDVTD